ncbi:MAG: hypothetical protein V1915_01935 [Candidatus Bathyarchaeota archaeon]
MLLTQEGAILVFTVAGISLKLADTFESTLRGFISATISAVCMGLLIAESASSSAIILGIMVGITLAGKLDQSNLIFGLGLALATAIIMGFHLPDLSVLGIITAGALIDEVGHDRISSRGLVGKLFRFRMVLKATVLMLAVFGFIEVGSTLGFFSFDICYDGTDILWSVYKAHK